MKKMISILLVLSMLLFAGCDLLNKEEKDPEAPEQTGDSTAGEPMTKPNAVDDVFSLNYNSESSMNPISTNSAANLLFAPLVYEGLYTVDENFVCEPTRLLTSAKTEDNQTWMFYINTDVKFHDGKSLTPADVYYSIERARYADLYKSRFRAVIAGVSPMGEDMVAITLQYPNAQFPALLNIPIIPEGMVNEHAPPGTGQYKFDAAGQKLVVNSDHPQSAEMPIGAVYLKEFKNAADIITSFEESVLDLVVNDPTGLNDLGYGAANDIRYFNTTTMHYLGFNNSSKFFSDANCRSAMNYVVNRSYVVTNLMGGSGSASTVPVSPVSPLYNETIANNYDYSLEKTLAALARANVKDHDDDGKLEYIVTGIPMEIDIKFIVNSESAIKVSAARKIAEDMTGLGLTVNLVELSWDDYARALNQGDFDMYYGEVRLTPDFNPREIIFKSGALNYGGGTDSACEEAVNQYLNANEEGRKAACDTMCQYIIASAPIVTIAFEKREMITHRTVVSGVAPTQYNVFNKFENWTINP